MNIRQSIIATVIAQPGLTTRQICVAMGQPLKMITAISANLHQLCGVAKLRSEKIPHEKGNTYWPTERATVDLRTMFRKPDSRRARREAMVVAGVLPATPTPRGQQRAYTSTKASKPKPGSHFVITRPPLPPPIPGRKQAETVDHFRKRGGVIQMLQPHESSHPLRHIHAADTASKNRQGRVQPRRGSAL